MTTLGSPKWRQIDQRRIKVQELSKSGLTLTQIAQALNVSRSTVKNDLRALSIRLRELARSTPTAKQKKAYKLRSIGTHYKRIGLIMGCSANNARRHVMTYLTKTQSINLRKRLRRAKK